MYRILPESPLLNCHFSLTEQKFCNLNRREGAGFASLVSRQGAGCRMQGVGGILDRILDRIFKTAGRRMWRMIAHDGRMQK